MGKSMDAPTYSDEYYAAQKAVHQLEAKFRTKLQINEDLDRKLVSFQANKSEPVFRWFHYREGFSKPLVEYILNAINAPEGGTLLDPFAGTGAAPFVGASLKNMNGIAVELLPVGAFFMQCRNLFGSLTNEKIIAYAKKALKSRSGWLNTKAKWKFNHLRITDDAFSKKTQNELEKFMTWGHSRRDPNFKLFLKFVAFSILEKISFTRKDGQYLRWDYRSPRFKQSTRKTKFNKGPVYDFFDALEDKLQHIIEDLSEAYRYNIFPDKVACVNGFSEIEIIEGSVLEKEGLVKNDSVDCVITSPPYCNRYDYTRTYALELAFLGCTEDAIKKLRQTLLTCTVENKPKQFEGIEPKIKKSAEKAFYNEECLQKVLAFLESEKTAKKLNNSGIYTMVKGYFYDAAIHLAQMSQKIRSGGHYVMVNDNVRYNGLGVPVDCILSSLAEDLGFSAEKIWVLPVGKGNSSQQMKRHGKSELRKCVYIWKKK